MKEEITIYYKNSHGEILTDGLDRDAAVELYLMLGEQLYSNVRQTPPKSGAPKQIYPLPPVKVGYDSVVYHVSH